MNDQFKAAVNISEMARMCCLGRSRFYQLIGSAFPEPCRDDRGRPYYTEEQQRQCLEVRRHNLGIDGTPVLFYAPRHSVPAAVPKRKRGPTHPGVLAGVRALGLTTATAAQVDAAVANLFPNGVDGVDPGEVIRQVFLSVKRENSSGNVGR
jgi:hypothetical protein